MEMNHVRIMWFPTTSESPYMIYSFRIHHIVSVDTLLPLAMSVLSQENMHLWMWTTRVHGKEIISYSKYTPSFVTYNIIVREKTKQ